ncbi:protein FAM83H-like isoform X2 [Astyanax mexicanus]|uniref:Protein FAM83H-like isoform X2 n=1 Tax=Astyanax mexicanus TaxID=7994 RepID=A0A8T2LVJ7_ASTMX|nr:protein FAM83H-like isoform X2 [Astyanax mexicanus]
MAHRSQCSSAGDNPLDPNYLPPHYREEYRLAIDALVEADLEGYYGFLQDANVVDFLSRPEIEYIKCTVQVPSQHTQPDRRYLVGGDGDGSSDTYWPIHSDLDAPGLDLGWPQQHRFVGPTEITTLVNPPDPEMPSIKEQVRRMIKNAQQVVAVAMDMFTDVDIFADILNAAMRNVAVYVLLDELNAHHFVAMVNNCRVNLDEIKSLRVRTVSGSTYYCHTGKSFKGQMMNRFLLVDCKIVLSGHYSFMWSFEKIHRCIAHVFVGQFVATFDEEFRILFAQSEPLVMENTVPYVEDYGNFPQRHTIENPKMFMKEHLPIENIRAEWPGRSFEDPMKVQHNLFSLRRGESVHSSTDEHLPLVAHAPQQFRGEHPFLDQRRLMQGPNNDMGRFRRQAHPGFPNYPQMNTGNRGEQNMEDFEMQGAHFPREQYFSQRAGPEQGYEIYRKPRDFSYPQLDQYPGPEFPHEMDDVEPPGGYDHVQKFLHSYPPVEKVPAENLLVPVQSPPRRHSMGQSFPCQTSPTQPNLPEQKFFFNVHHKRQDQKEGLRDWRISSYLTALQDSGPEDMEDLQRSDSFDSASYDMHKSLGRPCESEIPGPRQEHSDFNKAPARKLNVQHLDNLSLPEKSLDLQANFRSFLASNAKQTPTTTSESSGNTEGDKPEEPKEGNLTREESFRRRPNLAIQRSSRLRHSLIFSSNLELPTTEEAKSSLSQSSEDDPLKTSAVISNILEKKKPGTKEPFQWSTLIKPPCDPTLDSATKTESEDIPGKTKEESAVEKGETNEMAQKYSQMEKGLSLDLQVTENTQIQPKPILQQSNTFMDMNDPDCRLRFFKELAAKRKAELAQANVSTKDKVSKEPEKSKKEEKKPTLDNPTIPPAAEAPLQKCPVGTSQESNTKAPVSQVLTNKNLKHKSHDSKMTEEQSSPKSESSCRAISTSATDAEKIKLKQQLSEEHDPSPNTDDDNSASVVKPELQLGLQTRPKLLSQLRPIPNISSSEFSRTKFSFPSVLRPKHSKLSPTDPTALQTVPGASMSGPSQHPTASETGVIQHSTSEEAGKAKRTDTTQQNPAAVTSPSQQTPAIPAPETGPSKQIPAPETGPSKQIPASDTGPSKQIPASDTGPSKQIPASDTGPSKQIPAPETGPSKQIPAPETGPSKQIPASKTSPSEKIPAVSTNPSKQIPAAESDPSRQIPAKETDASQKIPAAETGPSTQIPVAETDPSKQIPVAKTDLSKQIPAAETDASQQIPAAESNASRQIPAEEIDASQKIPAAELDATQQIPAAETDASQQIPAAETDASQQIPAAEMDASQQIPAAEMDASQQIPAAEMDASQQILAAEMDASQQIPAAEMDASQQIPAAETDASQQIPAAEVDASQQIPAAESSPSQQMSSTEIGSFQQIAEAETGPSQQTPVAETAPFPQTPAAGTGQLTINIKKELDPTNTSPTIASPEDLSAKQHPVNTASATACPPQTSSDVSLVPTEESDPATNTLEAEKRSEHTACDLTLSPLNTPSSEVNLPDSSMPLEGDLCGNATAITVASSVQTDATALTSGSPAETVSKSETESCHRQPETSSTTDTAKTNVSLTNTSSLMKDAEPDVSTNSTSSECSSTANLTQTVSVSQPGDSSTDSGKLSSSSSETASVHSSSVDDHKSTNLQATEIQTPHDVSSPPNPEEESKNVDQDEEPIKHETQQQETSVSSISHEPEEAPLEAQTVGADGGSTNAEHSQGSQESQAPSSEKPTHQASTINVLSYSNLRDDTKVLLEQISAKNQGRTSKTSLASGDTTEDGADGNTKKDKQTSGYLLSRSKTWSARASPEERESLLKKMESMRKEKRVYSRFEVNNTLHPSHKKP